MCSTSGTRRGALVTKLVIYRQVEHIRGHLWHRYSLMANQVMIAIVQKGFKETNGVIRSLNSKKDKQ